MSCYVCKLNTSEQLLHDTDVNFKSLITGMEPKKKEREKSGWLLLHAHARKSHNQSAFCSKQRFYVVLQLRLSKERPRHGRDFEGSRPSQDQDRLKSQDKARPSQARDRANTETISNITSNNFIQHLLYVVFRQA